MVERIVSRKALLPASAKGRSAITNGNVLPGVDGRTLYARRFRDLFASHLSDLGGDDVVSEAERSLVRRVVTIEIALEELERKFASAGSTSMRDLADYTTAANALRRLLESLGLQRRAKDVTPSLSAYLRG